MWCMGFFLGACCVLPLYEETGSQFNCTSYCCPALPSAAGSLPLPGDLVPSLLEQLRLLLEAPASAAPAAATTTAGTSSLRAAAALALGIASLPFAPTAAASSSADGVAEGSTPALEQQQRQQLRALPDAAGAAKATASLLEDKDPKVRRPASSGRVLFSLWPYPAFPLAASCFPSGAWGLCSSGRVLPSPRLRAVELPRLAGGPVYMLANTAHHSPPTCMPCAQVVKKAAAALGYLCWGHSGQPVAAAAPAAPAPEPAAAAVEGGPAAVEGAQAGAEPGSGASPGTGAAGSSGTEGVLQPSVAALLGLRSSKNEEVLFAVGEALCFCFGGAWVEGYRREGMVSPAPQGRGC